MKKYKKTMNGVLSSSYAFVEQLHETHMDEKIFTIDINKCRRNILLNHKYDYCVFNVMDDPKKINFNMEIREGLYYVESDNCFPLRGNGWYYHSLIAHCLDNSIIARNDIKYVIYASSI